MKILVTGSSGHLGEALVYTLTNLNHVVIGLDLLPSSTTTHIGSISNRSFIHQIFLENPDLEFIFHTATLHKPHIVSHSNQDFIDTNATGTLNLLEESIALLKLNGFVFTSTTSTFGHAMKPKQPCDPAVWVTETLAPAPSNIYGITKITAESLCALFHAQHGLPTIILRTSRFFPEIDDDPVKAGCYEDGNIKLVEFLYRRVDIIDIVDAHLLSMEKIREIGFGKYIISATTPFTRSDCEELHSDAPGVLKRVCPEYEDVFEGKGWRMFNSIDRVYDNELARKELRWRPKYDFKYVLDAVAAGRDYRSELAIMIGKKLYHRGQVWAAGGKTGSVNGGSYPI